MESDFHAWAMLSTCYKALGEQAKLRHSAGKMVSEAQNAVQQDPSLRWGLSVILHKFGLGSCCESERLGRRPAGLARPRLMPARPPAALP